MDHPVIIADDGGRRVDYRYFMDVPTRWNDNDQLGHVNNVQYNAYIEAIVVRFLMQEVGVDWLADPVIPFAAETLCRFRRPLAFPETVEAAFRVTRIGRTSATYHIALFQAGRESPAAHGHFVHVWVDRADERPVDIPAHVLDVYRRYS